MIEQEIQKYIKGHQIILITDYAFGDGGKGKISEMIAPHVDANIRGTGGANAGHTAWVKNSKGVLIKAVTHMLPMGIFYDNLDKDTIMGNGVALGLEEISSELTFLEQNRFSYNNLIISTDAPVVMPYHRQRDTEKNKSQQNGGIGSTGKGIGPCYEDNTSRKGVQARDLLNKEIFAKKIKERLEYYPECKMSVDDIITSMQPHIDKIKHMIRDTSNYVAQQLAAGKTINIEGAQGFALSLIHGIGQYKTSSDCAIDGSLAGSGLSAHMWQKYNGIAFGIVKFPFTSKVGGGPFPTELGGEEARKYCSNLEEIEKKYGKIQPFLRYELEKYEIGYDIVGDSIKYNSSDSKIIALLNSKDTFEQSIGLRLAGEEYGATTGRPRRMGWTDAEIIRRAVEVNGPNLILTKADILRGAKTFKLGIGYELKYYSTDLESMESAVPIFQTYPGFEESLRDIKDPNNLPAGIKEAIKDLEFLTKGKVRMVSTGPEANHTLYLK